MRVNNKGFSLIEVIVAIAIMSIVAGIGSLSFSAARRQDVTRAAKSVDSLLSQVRMDNMSKANVEYMYIYINTDKDAYCYKLSNSKVNSVAAIQSLPDEEVEICSDSIVISAGTETSTATITDNGYVAISFEKSTGAFKCYDSLSGSSETTIEQMLFKRGRKTSKIVMASETGKHSVTE